MPFSNPRLHHFFISSLSFWAGLLDLGKDSFVRIFCAFSKLFVGLVGFLQAFSFFVRIGFFLFPWET